MSITTWLASLSRARRRLYRNTMRCPNRGALVRRSLFEPLEERRLLASDWHNALVSTDVNNDRNISPLDALLVINKLNVDGSKPYRNSPQGPNRPPITILQGMAY